MFHPRSLPTAMIHRFLSFFIAPFQDTHTQKGLFSAPIARARSTKLCMLSCTRSRGVAKGGRFLSASSTRQSSSQQQTFITREGIWRGSEIGNNLTDCRAAAAALAAHHEGRRFSTMGDAAAVQAASASSSSGTAAAAAAVAAAAIAGTVLSSGGNEAPPREDTSSTFPGGASAAKTAAAAVSAAAASLLPRSNPAKCGGHRKIQDMYHMVDSPIGQGEGRQPHARRCTTCISGERHGMLFFWLMMMSTSTCLEKRCRFVLC